MWLNVSVEPCEVARLSRPGYGGQAQPFGAFPKGHAQGSESKSYPSESDPAEVSALGNTISSQPESLLAGSDVLPLVDVALNGWAITHDIVARRADPGSGVYVMSM